jgi:hypothetical protein
MLYNQSGLKSYLLSEESMSFADKYRVQNIGDFDTCRPIKFGTVTFEFVFHNNIRKQMAEKKSPFLNQKLFMELTHWLDVIPAEAGKFDFKDYYAFFTIQSLSYLISKSPSIPHLGALISLLETVINSTSNNNTVIILVCCNF